MNQEVEEVSLTLNAEAAEALRSFIETNAQEEPIFLERNNLGGDGATWIVVATLAVQALPHLVTMLQSLTGRDGSREVIIGDITIKNPSPRDLELLRAMLAQRASESR